MLIVWLATIVTFILGYLLGSYRGDNLIADAAKSVKEKINPTKVGAVQKPPPETLANRGTVLEESEQAMEETLADIIELPEGEK